MSQTPLQLPFANRMGDVPDGMSGETRQTFLVKQAAMNSDLYGANGANGPVTSGACTQLGSAATPGNFAAFFESGKLFSLIGNPIAGNGADATDDVLTGIVLPAGAFDIAGRCLNMTFAGKLAANGNNKRIKVWLNPTLAADTVSAAGVISGGQATLGSGVLLLDSGVQTGNAVGWELTLALIKYGAAASNTQFSQGSIIFGTTHGGITVPVFAAQAENAAMNIVVTGSSATSSAANDVVLNFAEILGQN